MTIATAKNTPRNTYTATGGQTVFTIGFEFFATGDIKVFRNGTALTYNAAPSSVAQFSVQGTTNASDSAYEFGAGGTVTLGAGATADDSIVIVRDIVVERTTDFTPAASFDVTALNTQLDILMAMMAEREESASRSIRLPLAETTTGFDMQLPVQASRANKILEFDADGDPACTITSTNLSALGAITTDITAVAAVASNVTTVAGISANVTTCAGKASEITSVAAKASLITSDFVSDLNTLATSAIVTDLDILANADIVADLAILATSDVVSDLNTLATSAIVADLNILATSDIVSDLNTLATADIVSDINTLATSDIVSDLNTLATSDIVSDINTLATSDIVSDLNTLATSDFVSDLNIVGTTANVANIATVAANVAGVNSFAARYRVASSDPGSDNDAGDLVFNTSSNILKVYNGSSFDDVTGSTLAGLSDTNITSPADGSILLYDTGTSKYIDNVISGDATLADTGALTIAADAITGAKIADDAIDSEHYTDGSIDTAHLSADCVTGAKIADNAINSEHYTDGSIDTAHIADAQITLAKLAADAISTPLRPNAKPLIINGNMRIAQRATSVTGKTTDGYYTVDRMKNKLNDAGTYTISQSTDVPSGYGFTKSLKYDVTVAKDSPSAGTLGSLDYHVEAQDLQLLKYGTSNAQKLTFSFWVKSPKTGTHILSLTSEDGNRHIAKAYTVSSANTWENHIVNFDGDTSGTINDDNGSGFQIQWILVAGSNYTSGTLATSWASYTAANAYVGQVNCADNTSNDFFITGIQMEVGEFTSATMPSFQFETIIDNQNRCSRYFQKLASNNNQGVGEGFSSDGTGRGATMVPFLPMRASPTVTTSAASTFKFQQGVTTSGNGTGFIVAAVNNNQGANQGPAYGVGLFRVHIDVSVSGMAQDGRFCRGVSNGDSFVQVEAEL